jgi:hypothetical protein
MALTDREFWLNYWESHRDEVNVRVANQNLFSPVFEKCFANGNIKTSCELGGFPGTFSIYLKRKYGVNATLVDYVVHKPLLEDVLRTNDLTPNDLGIIEADIFNYQPAKTFDLVFSVGLIEHFEDTQEVIGLHLPYMNSGAKLVIFLPNFRGINGWFQRNFDMENYNKHNIKSMDVVLLKKACQSLGLKNIHVGWYSKFGIWLERENQQPALVRVFKKCVWFAGKSFFKIFPFESRWFSPYILLTAEK